MNIFKRVSRTLTKVGPTLRVTLFRDEALMSVLSKSPVVAIKLFSEPVNSSTKSSHFATETNAFSEPQWATIRVTNRVVSQSRHSRVSVTCFHRRSSRAYRHCYTSISDFQLQIQHHGVHIHLRLSESECLICFTICLFIS